ncbi:C40 family peptidase [Streptomyces lichenis]|uniref:C40 family peptidase n=1 Tax=Streptomyces lichenis TaxID=2306967 RepID=A0ABT0I7B2_9ACTN|nr:C40 family peptidase [Streptomyces lichenis]MCK8677216.1 C40 family peptidase [Streptomyces lichenis]
MPALASHRKPRSRTLPVLHGSSPAAVGVTTAAALASVALISSQSATAATAPPSGRTPTAGAPSPEEVSAKVDDLYRQAGGGDTGRTAAVRSGATAVGTAPAERPADRVTDRIDDRTADHVIDRIDTPPPRAEDRLPDAWTAPCPGDVRAGTVRDEAGCGEEDRTGGVAAETAPRVVKERSQSRLAQARLLLVRAAAERTPATGIPATGIPALGTPVEPRSTAVLAAARQLSVVPPSPPVAPVTAPAAPAAHATGSLGSEAARVVAFAEAQLGKPYVPGAAGPSSYDCSGLVRAAWKAAGVELPRDAGAQALAGTPVAMGQMRAGDLVFFHGGGAGPGPGGHVGIYKGDGMMIHAPGPGAGVREESVFSMPIHGSVRPA